ncbi:MAG: NitT/TauT family transport system ATP-binding protein [Chloroflexota bacterium]|jgi:NitT/TauT family transport system ATP-binding protein|nr:NitT/TauT family transport system ATP-binding protein [Chloroflexota bacterium]
MPWQAADGESPDGRREEHLTAQRISAIKLGHVSRSFVIDGRPMTVLDDVSFDVPAHGITAVVGPNGSGKSTLLRLVAGLLKPDSGAVEINGAPVTDADQRVGLVFQEPRLLPWRTALDNVAFPLELAGVGRAERHERAQALLELVGLAPFARAYPHQLSGGMRQRAAIGRALVREPQILLLDEPFSALDALTRERFNAELLDIWQRTGTTILVVTHSIPEAVFLADEVVVLTDRPGRVAARIDVPLGRPRAMDALDSAAFTRAAATIRAHLSGDPADIAAQEAAAAPVRDVLERAGAPAFFDPFQGPQR